MRLSDSSRNFQKKIYEALTGDAALMAAVSNKVFDYVLEDSTFPWIQIGDDTFKDWNTMDFYGKEATITIHTWSRKQGRMECKTIQGHIQRVLNGAYLPLESAVLVLLQQEFETSMIDPDGVTLHGIQRFRALIQEA